MSYAGEVRFRLQGDPAECSRYIPIARVLVERTVAMYAVGSVVGAATQTKLMADGAVIKVTVFEKAPPIITITPPGGQKEEDERWLNVCHNGVYLDESLAGGDSPGHWVRNPDDPRTLVRAVGTPPQVHLVNNRLDPTYSYVRGAAKDPRGVYIVPVQTPVGAGHKSGDMGRLCFVTLYRTGFFWYGDPQLGPLPTEPTWYKCFARAAIGTSGFVTPQYTDPANRVWPEVLTTLITEDRYLRVVIDFFSVGAVSYPQEQVITQKVYDVVIPGDPTVSGDAIPTGRTVAGRLQMQEAGTDFIRLAFVTNMPSSSPLVYTAAGWRARKLQDTGIVTLNFDGSHALSNVWEPYTMRRNSVEVGAEVPYAGAVFYGVPESGGHVVQNGEYATTRLYDAVISDVLSDASADLVYFWAASSSVSSSDLEWTETTNVSLVSVAPGAAMPTGWIYVDGPGYASAGANATAFMAEQSSVREYEALPARQTPYGQCRVSASYTLAHEVDEVRVSSPSVASGSVTWTRPSVGDNWTLTTVNEGNTGAFNRQSTMTFAINGTLTVEAFGHIHTIPYSMTLQQLGHISTTLTVGSIEPEGTIATNPFGTTITQDHTPVAADTYGAAQAILQYDVVFDGTSVDFHSLVGHPASTRLEAHPPTGAKPNLPFSWYSEGDRYKHPKFKAHVAGGILWVEMYWDCVGMEAVPPRNRYSGDGDNTQLVFFGRLWAFTTTGEKITVEPRTTTEDLTFRGDEVVLDPSGEELPLEVAHDPKGQYTYLSYPGERYPCIMSVDTPIDHKVRLPDGVRGDVIDRSR